MIRNILSFLRRRSQQFVLLLSLAVMVGTSSQHSVWALTPGDLKAVNDGYAHFNPYEGACIDPGTGVAPSGRTLPNGPGAVLDGHRLPAELGGTGNEERAVIINGKAYLAPPSKDAGNGLALAPKGMTDNDVKFYINMRWRYAIWNWRGDSKSGPEDVDWYNQAVRKVLVTDPKTGRGIITAVIESGPAPWTGTSFSSSQAPDYWQGYYDGTPTQYNGRVSGLAPDAFMALANTNNLEEAKRKLQRRPDNLDNNLYYQWAPDQSLPSGTIVQSGQILSSPSLNCQATASTSGFVFYSQYDPKWSTECYGPGSKPDCRTVATSGCGPSSLAMVVATMKNQSITPKQTLDYANANNMWFASGDGGIGSKWELLRVGPTHFGLNSKEIGPDLDAAISALKNGALVIASGTGATPYTSGGHILVLRGVTPGGKILIGDSNVKVPADKALNNTKEWEPSAIKQGLRNLWIVTKPGS